MSNVSLSEIIDCVACCCNVGRSDIMGRMPAEIPGVLLTTRDAAAWLMRRHTTASYHAISSALGMSTKQATLETIHNGVDTAALLYERNVKFRRKVEQIERMIDDCHERNCDLQERANDLGSIRADDRPVWEARYVAGGAFVASRL